MSKYVEINMRHE